MRHSPRPRSKRTVALLLLSFLLNGCAIPVKYEVRSSSEQLPTGECTQDAVVISHYPRQVMLITLPLPELRLVTVVDGKPQLTALVNPSTGKTVTGWSPLWSPDGRTIAFGHVDNPRGGRWKPALVRCNGSGLTVLDHEYGILGAGGAWSSDGSKLFVSTAAGHSGSMAFGTAKPKDFKIDIYNSQTRNLERSIPIPEHAENKLAPTVSPAGSRIAYADKSERLYLLDVQSQKEKDITSGICGLPGQGQNPTPLHALEWLNDSELSIAAGRSLVVYNCNEDTGRTLFTASTDIVRLRYVGPRDMLLVGYAYEKGTDISQVAGPAAIGAANSAAQLQIAPALAASTGMMVLSAGAAALIVLPMLISEARYQDTAFALVAMDGRVVHSFGVFRSRPECPSYIGNISCQGKYATISVYPQGVHLLDLENGRIYQAVAY